MFKFLTPIVFVLMLLLSGYSSVSSQEDYFYPDILIVQHVQGNDGGWLTINSFRFNGCKLTITNSVGTTVYYDRNNFGTIPCGYSEYYFYSNDYPTTNYTATILRKEGYIDNHKVWLHVKFAHNFYLPIIFKE